MTASQTYIMHVSYKVYFRTYIYIYINIYNIVYAKAQFDQ